MVRTNKKNSKPTKHKRIPLIYVVLLIALAVAIVARIIGWPVYHSLTTKKDSNTIQIKSRLAYVDGSVAANNVEVFYQSYIRMADKPAIQKKFMETVGTKNLLFYNEYYQHGFNPITCSTVMPTKVTTSLVSTGPVAIVNAALEYPDNTKATITARVVLDDKGLNIDSITCPGDKGNLPPVVIQ